MKEYAKIKKAELTQKLGLSVTEDVHLKHSQLKRMFNIDSAKIAREAVTAAINEAWDSVSKKADVLPFKNP